MKINNRIGFFSSAVILFCSSTLYAAPPQQPPLGHDFEALCQGKTIGTKVSKKQGDIILTGSCELGFKPNNPPAQPNTQPPKPQQESQGGARPPMPNLCQGKRVGETVTDNKNGKNITGTCEIRFKPDMPKA